MFRFRDISFLTKLYPVFSCEKTLLDKTQYRKDLESLYISSSSFSSFMITASARLSHFKKILLSLELAEVQTTEAVVQRCYLRGFFGGDKLI